MQMLIKLPVGKNEIDNQKILFDQEESLSMIPCKNCEKLVHMNEVDKHSSQCFVVQ